MSRIFWAHVARCGEKNVLERSSPLQKSAAEAGGDEKAVAGPALVPAKRTAEMDAMDTDVAGGEPMELAAARSGVQGLGSGGAWGLLTLARQLVDQGKPSLALQAVLMAMRSEGGEHAVLQTLHRARELYRNKLQASAAADELAALFAECVIAEAQPPSPDTPLASLFTQCVVTESQPSGPDTPPQLPNPGGPITLLDSGGPSILAMSGRKQIMLDAFADGSSFICLQCGGLVSSLRREEHLAYWCG